MRHRLRHRPKFRAALGGNPAGLQGAGRRKDVEPPRRERDVGSTQEREARELSCGVVRKPWTRRVGAAEAAAGGGGDGRREGEATDFAASDVGGSAWGATAPSTASAREGKKGLSATGDGRGDCDGVDCGGLKDATGMDEAVCASLGRRVGSGVVE